MKAERFKLIKFSVLEKLQCNPHNHGYCYETKSKQHLNNAEYMPYEWVPFELIVNNLMDQIFYYELLQLSQTIASDHCIPL